MLYDLMATSAKAREEPGQNDNNLKQAMRKKFSSHRIQTCNLWITNYPSTGFEPAAFGQQTKQLQVFKKKSSEATVR